jgi:hypothetical protein
MEPMDAADRRAAEYARRRDWDLWLCAQRRGLTAAWCFAVAFNVALLVVVVASLDPALIAVAGGVVGNLIVTLTTGRAARRSLAGRGQPRR